MRQLLSATLLTVCGLFVMAAHADLSDFETGPAITDFGPKVLIEDSTVDKNSVFKVAFDVAKKADAGKENSSLTSVARFLNMHVAAGVPQDNIRLAVVVHGGASKDLLWEGDDGADNPSAPLIAALIDAGVTIELCGQSAAYYGIDPDDLLPGVRMRLSAMTAHAQLQQQGFTLNPF